MSMSDYQVTRSSAVTKWAALLGLVTLIVLVAAPYWAGRADMRLMGELFLYLALASLWNLMAGYAGLVSVGQQAYVGFGGYMLFALTIFGGVHPIGAIVVAGALGALIAVPVALLIFRLRGAYFAIGTWVVAEVFRLSFAQVWRRIGVFVTGGYRAFPRRIAVRTRASKLLVGASLDHHRNRSSLSVSAVA